MIKTIMKRDGVTIEPFTPAKLINWGEWASRSLPGRGDWWHDVIKEVLDKFKDQEVVHSQKLQKTLITTLLQIGSWPANKMAGRLYAASLRKELYGELMPTVRALHHKLIKVGLMEKQPYTTAEYAEVETFIDHERDFDLAHSQIHQNRKKYALRPQNSKAEYETPQFIFMRMALAAASFEETSVRMKSVRSYYDHFSLAKINPPSPNYINFGTSHHGYASCFPAGSMVSTDKGRVRIEDVKVGDMVLTHYDQYKKVYHTQDKLYKGKFVRLNTVALYNSEFNPTEDHRVYAIKNTTLTSINSDIAKNNLENRRVIPEWIKADNLRVGDLVKLNFHSVFDETPFYIWDVIRNIPEIAKRFILVGNTITPIYNYSRENLNVPQKQPNISNTTIFNEDLFRLFGYFLADGCVCNPTREDYNKHLIFTFNTKEKVFIDDVIKIAESLGGRAKISDNPADNSTKITISSKPLTELFGVLLGCGFNTKRLSNRVLSAPVRFQRQLLIGLLRGDGCAIINGYTLTLSNIELIAQIRDVALRCGMYFNVSRALKPRPGETQPRATIVFNVAGTSFGKEVGKNYHKCRQDRESFGQNIFYIENEAFARVRVISSYESECQVYDLSVEDDKSFTVNGIAVHNCCLIMAEDTIDSLAIHDHIAYVMTGMSAGIGTVIHTRGPGEAVRGGAIEHQGKHGYYQSLGKATKANIQAGRGGACNTFFSVYDPEIMLLTNEQSVMAADDKQNRDIKFTVMFNSFFADKVAKCEKVFQFTVRTQPELWKLLHSSDLAGFADLYNKIDADPSIEKTYFDAREYLLYASLKANEVSTLHFAFIDEMNIHTPFDEPIYSSNLCVEITLPTAAYRNMTHLYRLGESGHIKLRSALGVEHTADFSERVVVLRNNERKITYAGGLLVGDVVYESNSLEQTDGLLKVAEIIKTEPTSEVALCSLAAIPVCNMHSDEEYAEATYRSLKMIDYCIHRSTYKLPNIGWTAKNRMNAAVGMMGVSTVLAKNGLKYGSIEGRRLIHRIAERHAYFVIRASLRIAKERGNAPWIHKTKWPEGWLPIDTYNKNVDLLVDEPLHYDWETLRAEIIEQGGIAHCSVVANMPTESSSKSSGVPRSVMQVEEISAKRADTSNVVDWVAVDSDIYEYESIYDTDTTDTIAAYAIIQKFADQTTSADLAIDRNVKKLTESGMVTEFLMMAKYGMKTRYYQQTKSYQPKSESGGTHGAILEAKNNDSRNASTADDQEQAIAIEDLSIDFDEEVTTTRGCDSGACST